MKEINDKTDWKTLYEEALIRIATLDQINHDALAAFDKVLSLYRGLLEERRSPISDYKINTKG